MKQSHLTTPRTLDDACFVASGEAFYLAGQRSSGAPVLAAIAAVVAILAGVLAWAA